MVWLNLENSQLVSILGLPWDVVPPLPTPHPSSGLPGPARLLLLTYLPGGQLLLGATWYLRPRKPGGCLHWGYSPVSRLGLVCHKELLNAHSFPLSWACREAQIGTSETPGRGEDQLGPSWSHLKALLCASIFPCSCSAVWKPAGRVGSGPAPFPLPSPLSHCRGI